MRKIGSDKEIERKRKTGAFIISLFLLGILVVATFGYAFLYSPSSAENTPVVPEGKFAAELDGQTFYLSNSESAVEEIPVEISSTIDSFVNVPLYFDVKNQLILSELLPIFQRYSSKIQPACYGECEENLPEKNCDSENLIVWRESSENKVSQEGNCIFIDGDLKSADAFIYSLIPEN